MQELDGANTPTTTSVTGTLLLGAIATQGGATTIASTGTLTGAGSAATVINQGTVSAVLGLQVSGNDTQVAGGTLLVQANPNGTGTTLVVGGAASLAGQLAIALTSPATSYNFGTRYTAVSAAGGVNGNFGNVAVNATADFVVSADAKDSYYTLRQISTTAAGGTPNQIRVGLALDRVIARAYGGNDANGTAIVNAINSQTSGQTQTTQTSLSGEGYAGLASAGVAASQAFGGSVLRAIGSTATGVGQLAQNDTTTRVQVASIDPTAIAIPGSTTRYGVWMSAYGQSTTTNGDGNAHGVNTDVGGGAVGADVAVLPNLHVGVALGYGASDVSIKTEGDQGHADNTALSVYAGLDLGRAYANGMVGMGYASGNMRRNIFLTGLSTSVLGSTRGVGALGAVEGGLHYVLSGDVRVNPFLALQVDGFNQNRSAEESISPLALKISGVHSVSVQSTLGGRIGKDVMTVVGQLLSTELTLGWSHQYADTTSPVSASFIGMPTASFTVATARTQRDHAVVGLGLAANITARTTGFARNDRRHRSIFSAAGMNLCLARMVGCFFLRRGAGQSGQLDGQACMSRARVGAIVAASLAMPSAVGCKAGSGGVSFGS
jgi:outer membrane autotransporter protein